jgi:hypothetical protein
LPQNQELVNGLCYNHMMVTGAHTQSLYKSLENKVAGKTNARRGEWKISVEFERYLEVFKPSSAFFFYNVIVHVRPYLLTTKGINP